MRPTPHVHTLVLALTGMLVVSCQSTCTPKESTTLGASASRASPSQSAAATNSATAAVRVAPRLALVLKGTNDEELDIYRLGAETPLGFKVSSTQDGTVQIGDARPKLSPDGRWLAYGVAGRLWIAAVDSSKPPEQVTQHTKGEVALLLGGWSPNGETLLFHQGKRMHQDDDIPMPPGVSEGFYLLHVADKRVIPLPDLKGFDVWDSDSRHVYWNSMKAPGAYQLLRGDTGGGATTVAQETVGDYGFGQLARCGADLAVLLNARIERSKPDGSSLVHVTPQGGTAEYQDARCSPDAQSVAYTRRVDSSPNSEIAIEVALPAGPKSLHRCKGGCSAFGWESPTSILALNAGEVYRLHLDGTKETVAHGVAWLVVPE